MSRSIQRFVLTTEEQTAINPLTNNQMNWKEQFNDLFTADIYEKEWSEELTSFKEVSVNEDIQDFISTEIIEKLIADIPSWDSSIETSLTHIKQQLRDKWLGTFSNKKSSGSSE
jgi:hypothetical protein